ncbi:unnamed protein product [Arctogadus glacialis]
MMGIEPAGSGVPMLEQPSRLQLKRGGPDHLSQIRFKVDQSMADAAHTRIRLNINAGVQRDSEQRTRDKTPNQSAEVARLNFLCSCDLKTEQRPASG